MPVSGMALKEEECPFLFVDARITNTYGCTFSAGAGSRKTHVWKPALVSVHQTCKSRHPCILLIIASIADDNREVERDADIRV